MQDLLALGQVLIGIGDNTLQIKDAGSGHMF